jgi:hypothetical protein
MQNFCCDCTHRRKPFLGLLGTPRCASGVGYSPVDGKPLTPTHLLVSCEAVRHEHPKVCPDWAPRCAWGDF